MFVTFYSYKGGVGRTLALVNVAHLLAMDREEPCKVLVWDFDLEAPGLTHLIPMRWGARKQGFVDLVDKYCTEAQIPPITEYIYESDTKGIDILPAGYVDERYSAKLEKINWQSLYEKRRGYDFLEQIKSAIESLQAPYDYVLIDARTGYSDVGGICLQQLPSLVVLMFRLNAQNLEGTAKTYTALGEFAKKTQKRLDVIPVISPAWPFATLEANRFVKKARSLFPAAKPLEISFDGSLTFGEKILVKDRQKYEIRPRTIDDYEQLAREIRRHNLTDALTMNQSAKEKQAQGQHEEAFKIRCALIERKPRSWKYWTSWAQIANELPSQEKASAFIDAQLEKNPHLATAYAARARLSNTKPKAKVAAFTQAIHENPEFAQAYFERGQALWNEGLAKAARTDFEKYLSLRPTSSGRIFHGLCCLSTKDFETAQKDFRSVLEVDPKDVQSRANLAISLLMMGRFAEAKVECEKTIELNPISEGPRLILVHILARMGESEQAKNLLRELASPIPTDQGDILNISEAYVTNEDPEAALALLRRIPKTRKRTNENLPIAKLLKYLCCVLQGKQDEQLKKAVYEAPRTDSKAIRKAAWRYLELRSFLLYPGKESKLSPSDREALLTLLESYEKATEENPASAEILSGLAIPPKGQI